MRVGSHQGNAIPSLFCSLPTRECPQGCRRGGVYSSPRLSRVAMSTQQRIHHFGSGESLSAAAIPTPQSGSPCASQHFGREKKSLLVARGCMRGVRAPPAEGLAHSKASRPLSSSSLLSEGEFETEVEELEGRKDNVRERDSSGWFTGDGGVSLLANRWRKSPTTSPSQRRPKVRGGDCVHDRLHRVKEPGLEVELARNLGLGGCINRGHRRGARGYVAVCPAVKRCGSVR